MFESRTMPPSLFGFAVAAFLLVAVILGARETQDPSNTALIGSAPISAPSTI